MVVYGVYIVEIVQTILITHDAFSDFGFGFGNIEAVKDIQFEWLTVPVMSGLGKLFLFGILMIIEHRPQSH